MKWTELQTEFLISVYPDHQTEHIAKVLGFTVHRVYNKAFKLRLKKSKEYLQIHGQRLTGTEGYNYRFKKGQTPPNKDKSWSEWMSEEGQERSRKTTFKKDHIPATCRYFGKPYLLIRDRKSGHEKTWYIQVNKRRRTYLSFLCEQNGLRLKNQIPRLKEGYDFSKVPTMEDIEIISYKENMKRNTYHRFPEPIRKLIQIKGALNRQIHKYEHRDNIS